MTVQITSNRVRLACDIIESAAPLNKLTGESPVLYRNMDNQIEIGLFNNGTIVDSFANLATITLEIKDDDNIAVPAYLTYTLTVAQLTACLQAAWDDDSGQHGTFTLPLADMDLPAKGASQEYWLVIYASTNDATAKRIKLAKGVFSLEETGADLGDASSAYYPRSEADATFVKRNEASATWKFSGGGWYVYNPDTALYHLVGATGPAGAVVLTVDQAGVSL